MPDDVGDAGAPGRGNGAATGRPRQRAGLPPGQAVQLGWRGDAAASEAGGRSEAEALKELLNKRPGLFVD